MHIRERERTNQQRAKGNKKGSTIFVFRSRRSAFPFLMTTPITLCSSWRCVMKMLTGKERKWDGTFITGHSSRANQQRPHASPPYPELNPFSRFFFPVFSPPFHVCPPIKSRERGGYQWASPTNAQWVATRAQSQPIIKSPPVYPFVRHEPLHLHIIPSFYHYTMRAQPVEQDRAPHTCERRRQKGVTN